MFPGCVLFCFREKWDAWELSRSWSLQIFSTQSQEQETSIRSGLVCRVHRAMGIDLRLEQVQHVLNASVEVRKSQMELALENYSWNFKPHTSWGLVNLTASCISSSSMMKRSIGCGQGMQCLGCYGHTSLVASCALSASSGKSSQHLAWRRPGSFGCFRGCSATFEGVEMRLIQLNPFLIFQNTWKT